MKNIKSHTHNFVFFDLTTSLLLDRLVSLVACGRYTLLFIILHVVVAYRLPE
jgi:hypothetical protein